MIYCVVYIYFTHIYFSYQIIASGEQLEQDEEEEEEEEEENEVIIVMLCCVVLIV